MPVLTKTRSVLDFVDLHGGEGDRFTTFQSVDDDTGEPVRVVKLLAWDWQDLGEPDVITITIEPGDKLNED